MTSIITRAFVKDPLWSGAMSRADGSTDHHFAFWQRFVDGALRYPWVWVMEGGEAASVWIPPGQTEMSSEQEDQLSDLAREHLGPGAEPYLELLSRFEAAHPRDEPHYYLTLLARTQPIVVVELEWSCSPMTWRSSTRSTARPTSSRRIQ